MDPTGFRIHISINSVARIQAGDQSALDTMPSIMQHILRRYLVILCVMLEELISLPLNHHTDSVVWCLHMYVLGIVSGLKNVVDHVPKITDSAIVIEFELVKTPAVQNHDQMLTLNSVLELSRLIRVSSCRSGECGVSFFLLFW